MRDRQYCFTDFDIFNNNFNYNNLKNYNFNYNNLKNYNFNYNNLKNYNFNYNNLKNYNLDYVILNLNYSNEKLFICNRNGIFF